MPLSQQTEDALVIESFPLTYEGYTYKYSKIAYVRGRPPVPVVFVHANYAGLKQFDVDQAAFLARVGYVGLAVDLYKDEPGYSYKDRSPPAKWRATKIFGKQEQEFIRMHNIGSNAAMDNLLRAPKYWRGLMAAYLDSAYKHPAVAGGLGGAIGYCFGGQCVFEQLRAGHQLQAIVSFHGLFHSRPRNRTLDRRLTPEEFLQEVDLAPNNYNKDCKVLVEHGDYDNRPGRDAESIAEWKIEMDAQNIDWRFNRHARTPHGFALAPSMWSSEYTEVADRRSTLSMLSLFAEVWPTFTQYHTDMNACNTRLGQNIMTASTLAKL